MRRRPVQLKNDHVELHDVEIEIYGADGAQADKIAGDEFEYDKKSGIASAEGPVEMILTRPPRPAGSSKKVDSLPTAADAVDETGQVQVKTSGVTFDQNTGVVTTDAARGFLDDEGIRERGGRLV